MSDRDLPCLDQPADKQIFVWFFGILKNLHNFNAYIECSYSHLYDVKYTYMIGAFKLLTSEIKSKQGV